MIKYKPLSDLNTFSSKNSIGMHWRDIVGKALSERCSPQSIKNDVLLIYSLSPSWSHHINALRHDIMEKVNEKMGLRLKKIRIINSTFKKSNLEALDFYNDKKTFKSIAPKDASNLFLEVKDMNIKKKLERVASFSLAFKEEMMEEN